MKHLGDITLLNGDKIPVVDCITGGSPCQDLSIAGKRAGLSGERSGLFMDQMRIVKEMRERDRNSGRTGSNIRPRYMVWENVPGAFSSGKPKGSDFAAVIEEIIKVCEPDAAVHVCVPGKGWTKSGCYYAEDGSWSIAWRLHDAQFWGVPQRRKRIALVADFGGLTAPEILFERKGVSGNTDQSEEKRQKNAGGTRESTERTMIANRSKALGERTGLGIGNKGEPQFTISSGHEHAVAILNDQGGSQMSVSYSVVGTLRSQEHGHQPIVAGFKYHQGSAAGNIGYEEEISPTLSTQKNPAVYDSRGNGKGKIAPTITGDHQNRVTDYTALCIESRQTLQASMNAQKNDFMIPFACNQRDEVRDLGNKTAAIQAQPGMKQQTFLAFPATVRRLTPIECERLQGYPDHWTDIGDWMDSKGKKRKTSDTARYKALGNSIALPFWQWLLDRISDQYRYTPTLGSLFDGIGGFPLCWERKNGKGTALWASEIEEFPIAVTKKHFPEKWHKQIDTLCP